MKLSLKFTLGIFLLGMFFIESSRAQTNESSVTNSAAPSASSVTTGGTNINYQTNNAYNNEMGFGGGVFCRTPTLYFGGNAGKSDLDSFDGVTNSGNVADNFSVNAGVLFPFGSSVHKDCKQLASTITLDRMISSELSSKISSQGDHKGMTLDLTDLIAIYLKSYTKDELLTRPELVFEKLPYQPRFKKFYTLAIFYRFPEFKADTLHPKFERLKNYLKG